MFWKRHQVLILAGLNGLVIQILTRELLYIQFNTLQRMFNITIKFMHLDIRK